jgi:hypothetical protein
LAIINEMYEQHNIKEQQTGDNDMSTKKRWCKNHRRIQTIDAPKYWSEDSDTGPHKPPQTMVADDTIESEHCGLARRTIIDAQETIRDVLA